MGDVPIKRVAARLIDLKVLVEADDLFFNT